MNSLSIRLGDTKDLLCQLLIGPIEAYKSDLTVLLFLPSSKNNTVGGNFTNLLFLLPFGLRRKIAHLFAKLSLQSAEDEGFIIKNRDAIDLIFGEVCGIMIIDQIDGNLFGSKQQKFFSVDSIQFKDEMEGQFTWDEIKEEQTLIAKMTHLIKTKDLKENFLVIVF
jgi:vacuolar protein sorting-associated protein 35